MYAGEFVPPRLLSGRPEWTDNSFERRGAPTAPVVPAGSVRQRGPVHERESAMYNLLMKSSRDYNEWEENQGRLYDVSRLVERIF